MTTESEPTPDPYSEDPETAEEPGITAHDHEFPWPPRGNLGVVEAFTSTWRESVSRPAEFYRKMPPKGLAPAVGYYMLIGILTEGIRLFWGSVFDATGISTYLAGFTERATPSAAERLIDFLLSPVWLIITIFVVAGIIHLFVIMLVPNRRSYERTTCVLAYSYSPMLFAIVPFVGSFAGFIWSVVLVVIGLREVHNTTTGRALSAVLIPFAITFFIGLILAFFVGLLGLGMLR